MSFLIHILACFRFWIVVFGCVFLGFVLGDISSFTWTFQQPTYVLQKETLGLSEYTCDTAYTECRINFDFTSSIPTEEPSTHYNCLIDFGFGSTPEDNKCNPNTVIFPSGDHTVHLLITHRDTATLVREGTIIIHNTSDGGGGTGGGDDTGTPPVYSAGIQWQSSTDLLLETDAILSEYTCDPTEPECRINLLVLPKKDGNGDSQLTCLVTASFELLPSVSDPCNPLQSIVPQGDHILTLQIFAKTNPSFVVATRTIILKNPVIDTSIDPLRVTSTLMWQSPTYILLKENTDLTEYTCNPANIDCKINILVTPFLDGVESNKITCEISTDFVLEPTSDPCNPNTSIVPIGDHTLTIRMLQKSDSSLLTTREITIKNSPVNDTIDPLRITSSFIWQSPTYLLLKEDISLTEYTCDPAQSECKINLSVTPLLDGSGSTKVTCYIFSDFELIPTSDACNPNTSSLPVGDHILTIQVLQKSDMSVLTTRHILLKNPAKTIGGGGGGGSGGGTILLDLSSARIAVQSGLDTGGNCRSEKCQVNFLAEVPPGAVCHWNFGTGIFETPDTDKKCNPGYVRFGSNSLVTLTVSDPISLAHTVTHTLQVVYATPIDISLIQPEPHIDVQGVLGKNKRLTDGGITCAIGKNEYCSLNFTAENTLNAQKYFWSFGNGNTSEKENPGAEKYPLGIHRVILHVTSSSGISREMYFTVEVVKSFDEPKIPCLECEKMKGKIQISAVLANPPHADTVEWIEIKNSGSEGYSLDTCILSDETKRYTLSGNIAPSKTIRLRQMQTGLSLGNTHDTLELHCGEILIDTFSWNFAIPSGYILRREMLDRPPVRVDVISTVDGDTIDVMLHNKKTRVRLLGIDTPETVHPRKEIEKFGKEASDFTKKTLSGKTVWMTFDHEPIDHYGRTLGYIWECAGDFDDSQCQLFNGRLLTEGYARMERRFAFMYYESFDTLEKEAQKKKVGIWSDSVVAGILSDISAEEKMLLEQEQEKIYLELQQELLELAKKQCEEEGICEEIPTWADITKKMTTLSVRSLVSGVFKISGRTWGDLPLKTTIYLGEQEVYTAEIRTNTFGEYAFEWYPKTPGEYRVEVLFESPDKTSYFTLEKTLSIKNISEHFMVALQGKILVQGKMTKNRWISEDGSFHCLSRGLCSVNLAAEYNRKDHLTYTWQLPHGEVFTGKNPKSFKVGYGDFSIQLRITDDITQEELTHTLIIHHNLIPKAAKKTSSSSKYTLDFKDATQDIGGGILPEKSSTNLTSILLVLASLSGLSFFFFGKRNIDI